jgi:hypothetical protein
MNPPRSISDSLDTAEWELIVHTLRTMKCGVEGKDARTRELRAKLGITRIILYEEIKTWNGNETIDLSFFVGSLKTIRRLEKEFESCGIKKTEFLIFLELLLGRFGKQKLKARKPFATRSEFKKMKEMVEDGYGSL